MFILAAMSLGAALALCILYISVPVTLVEEQYRYVIERPPLASFFKLSAAALLGGALAAGVVSYVVTEVSGPAPGVVKLFLVGFFYGVLVPFVTGLLIPMNLFLLNLVHLSSVTEGRTLGEEFADTVFGTPMFTFMHGAEGIYQGFAAGAALFVGASLVLFGSPLDLTRQRAFTHTAAAVLLSLAIVVFLIVGPFGFFESLVDWFAVTY